MSFLDDAMTSIGQGLAQTAVTALSAETGVNVGATLGVIFNNSQSTAGQFLAGLSGTASGLPDGPEKSLLLAQINQQTTAIANLGDQLSGISGALQHIESELASFGQELQKIAQQQLFQEWETVDVQLVNALAKVDAQFTTYGNFATPEKSDPSKYSAGISEVAGFGAAIINNGDMAAAVNLIHSSILSGGQAKSVLDLWSSMVAPLVQNGTMDYRRAVQQYFQYYRKLVYGQLRATNLIMEAYNLVKDHGNAQNAWTTYLTNILNQETAFISALVPLVYSAVDGGIFNIPSRNTPAWNFTAVEASLQLNPGAQFVKGDSDIGNAYYQPSPIFKEAEQLLANLFVTSLTDRRIVVHMIYENEFGISDLLNALDLPLQSVTTSQRISSLPVTTLGSPYPFPAIGQTAGLPDTNLDGISGIFLQRYVFTDSGNGGTLTDGQYRLADLTSGQGALKSINTYMSGFDGPGAPFQQKSIVNYVVEVSSASPFDFMNFYAYSVPMFSVGDQVALTAVADADTSYQ